ncbi:uncharacterized protein LOC143892512 isoform X3 [Tasmannia lanceolata]|uniref:uncharacterized protein LOC143892512 isoform X3 n=1 Tax=Tasmannia lanceolata TaxID=3420 RepID=UPI0040638FB1
MVKGLKLCFRTWKAFSAIQSKGEFWPQRGSYGAVRFVGTLLQTKMERMRSGKDHSDMSVRLYNVHSDHKKLQVDINIWEKE